jgi:hypothetical protein
VNGFAVVSATPVLDPAGPAPNVAVRYGVPVAAHVPGVAGDDDTSHTYKLTDPVGSPPTELPVTATASVTVPDGPNVTFPDATVAVDEGALATVTHSLTSALAAMVLSAEPR